jgi:glyoxylase-like metal-dependent hydrolase (beta-lactamase superfamily II)
MTERRFGSKRYLCAAVFAVLMLTFALHAVFAEAPMVKTQVPGYYRLMLGQFEITALYDGSIAMDTKLLHNTSPEEIKTSLARAYINGPAAPGSVNAYLINTGTKLVLVDAGAAMLFGPDLGKVVENLKASGYDPAQIDAVFITHLHGDHFGGLLDTAGKLVFPRATVYVAKPENDFWLSTEIASTAPAGLKVYIKMAVDAAAPCLAQGRWKTIVDGDTPVQGIRAIMAPGHTPGHTVYEIKSGDQKLSIIGDIIHVGAVQFPNPQTSIDFDTDQKQAVATRLALFKKLASDGALVAGMHLPFPGIGHLRADSPDAYTWAPIQFAPIK